MMYVVQRRLDEDFLFVIAARVQFGPQLVKSYRLSTWSMLLLGHRRSVCGRRRHHSQSFPAVTAKNPKQKGKQDAKLFLKVVVEPTVQERVDWTWIVLCWQESSRVRNGTSSEVQIFHPNDERRSLSRILINVIQSTTVEERVVDGRAHGDNVRTEVDQKEVRRVNDQMTQILGREDNGVER